MALVLQALPRARIPRRCIGSVRVSRRRRARAGAMGAEVFHVPVQHVLRVAQSVVREDCGEARVAVQGPSMSKASSHRRCRAEWMRRVRGLR